MNLTSRIGIMGIAALAMGGYLNAVPAQPREAATTNTAEPEPVVVESRQVRRARERREAKNRIGRRA